MDIIFILLVGLCAGWLSGQIMKGSSFGLVNNLIVGVIGAALGGVLLPLIGLHPYGLIGKLISATLGSLLLLAILKKFGRAP